MKIIKNKKNFKIIATTKKEIFKVGGFGICDSCTKEYKYGFLVCVLNWWFCKKCFKKWYEKANERTYFQFVLLLAIYITIFSGWFGLIQYRKFKKVVK